MLSPVVKDLLEKRLGSEIRTSFDCLALQTDIERITKERIGVNTIKRLLGLSESGEPRISTLDVIARYLGYDNWDLLAKGIQLNGTSEFNSLDEVEIKSLNLYDVIELTYSPNRKLELLYCGDKSFKVQKSINGKLKEGDCLEIHHFVLNYPLIISEVTRDGKSLGRFTAGKVSGLTSIRLI
ncbi:hypothetical protein M2138_001992 [Dysgonomonadaceae bacterium PH5-43]|nr:hypothetical protein [Dysgonomonadaceae bacterium PH5-43]